MKKTLLIAVMILLASASSGCVAMKQNRQDVNQLKNQMVNVESVLARQNLLIQQNKNELEALLDRNDELAIAVSEIKSQSTYATTTTRTTMSSPRTNVSIQKIEPQSAVISDKLQPGPSLREVQMALRNAGFYTGNIDGKAGPLTRSAIKQFQQANGLEGDGIVGRRTWAKLKDYI